jgi:16S rRNA (uracil1498-N3)-methyltransferase
VHARFHAPDAERDGDIVSLPDEEAQHLTRVLRLKIGASIRVFNGRGAEFDAVVEHVGKNAVQVRVGHLCNAVPESRVAVTLAQGVLKADKMDDVIRDAVMIGVTAIQPVVTARSEVTLQSLARGHRQERWQRIAVSSAKQCGRAVVPPVLESRLFDSVVASLQDLALPQPALMCVEPSAAAEVLSLTDLDTTAPRQATVLVGPEGGWTPEELEKGAAVSRQVTLGARTLRADAMPLIAITALLMHWREL